jgi:filamentous hemagglutinin
MDVRSPLFQNVATLLVGVMFLNPIVGAAADLTVAAGSSATVGQAGNGVPIVNIAAPNGSGLSHNTFKDYNVGQQGLILNNATERTQNTQLGGIILGNANLNGKAAGLILNEVTGANASRLQGYTEVAGKSAHVVVANPHGISCDGCGFINTPRVTLSTGTPIIENGRLDRFDVNGGNIAIEGQGLNASNVDQFDLITRSAKINAELHANKLNIIAGRNEVDATTLAATAKAPGGSDKPLLAIDSSALGGMYAGAIRLVGTEAGVGVKLAGDMAASAGDIQIDANGKLSMAQAAASRDIRLKGERIELNGKAYAGRNVDIQAERTLSLAHAQSLAAREHIELKGAHLDNQGLIEAGINGDNSRNLIGDVTLSGESLRNSGSVLASRDLNGTLTGQLDNRAGALSGNANTTLTAALLDNREEGVLLSSGSLTVNVDALDNRTGLIASGQTLNVTATAGVGNQAGEISSQGDVTLTGEGVDNRAGLIAAGGQLTVTASELNNSAQGALSSQGSLTLNDAAVNNQGGAIVAEQRLEITGKSLDNRGGLISGKADVEVDVEAALDNRVHGTVVADGKLVVDAAELRNGDQGQVAAKGDLKVTVRSLEQQGDAGTQAGELLSQGKLTLDATRIDNRQGGLIAAIKDLDVRASEALHNSGGEISTQALASVRVQATVGQPAALLDNSNAGLIIGDQGLSVTVQRLLNYSKGVLSGRDSLVLVGDSLDNSAGGILSSEKALSATLTGALNNHDKGALLSGGSLQVEADSIDNTQSGLLSSTGALTVSKGTLNNQGGELVSGGQLTVTNSRLDNSNGGVISAKQALSIGTGQLDNQNKGLITSAAGVSLTAGQLNNHDQGAIASKGAMSITATGLDQHGGGELVSETSLALDLQGGDLNNSDKGLIATPGALLLHNLGKADNSAGGEISSAKSFLLNAAELNNSAGRIISSQGLHLQITQALLNNLKGALSAAKLTVEAASLDNSGAGVLASTGDLTVILYGDLDNHDQGLISAGTALTIDSAMLNNSESGLLASDGALQLTTGEANNQGGAIASQATLNATTANLDNRSGVISSQQALTLVADAVDNRDNGLITSASSLTVTADSLDSSRHLALTGGEVSAKGDLVLTLGKLIQQQGRLVGEANVSFDMQGGDLDNRGGLLFAKGPLTLANLGKLDNRGGEVSSSQSYSLVAGEIDNGDEGKLISSGTLGIDLGAGKLRNATGGLISGLQGLTVKAGSLDNSGVGTLSSRDGEVHIELSGTLDNSGEGALVSKGKLTVDAASLDNSAKGILSSEGDLELTLSGKLDNRDGSLIDTQGTLSATADAVDNHAGQIGSQAAATVTAASLDNSAGQLSSNAALTLTLTGDLLNTHKGQMASAGPLVLKAAAIDNQGGSLVSQNLLRLTGTSLNNASGGTLAAHNAIDIVLSGALNNSAYGLIHGQQGAVGIQAQSLNNSAGTLSGKKDVVVKLAGKLENQSGRIESREGNLDLQKSSAVDNGGGVLSSVKGWLKLVSAGLFDNDAGTTQAQSVEIDAKGIDNRNGHISALTGDTHIDAGTATFNNQGGGLYAHQLLEVTAGNFNNQGAAQGQGGKAAAQRIDFSLAGALNNGHGILESGSTLTLGAASVDNQLGRLRSLGASGTTLISGGLLDNRSGLIETANTTLQLNVTGLQNSGGIIRHVGTGTFGLSTSNVMGAGGTLTSNGVLGITANSWVNNSVLQAGTLNLNIGTFTQTASGQLLATQALNGSGGSWTNHGLLASDGSLSLNLTGAYGGNGQLTSLGNLSLSATSIDLPTAAWISGGGLSNITSTGLLSNRGRLTSAGDLILRAGTLNNYGTLGSAEKLRLYAPTLLNEHGLIFSGGDMALRVNDFTNSYADVYSLAGLDIAKDDQLARSRSVQNISATFESAGNMQIRAQTLDNRTEVFSLGRELISGYIAVQCNDCTNDHYNVDYITKEFYQTSVLDDSPSAFIVSGRNFNFTGGDLFNRQSSISAAENITIQATSFSNIGVVAGSIERTRIYNTGRVTDGTVKRFIANYLEPYNQRNNPDFPNIYYGDSLGNIRLAIAQVVHSEMNGRDSYRVKLFDSVTGQPVLIPHSYGSFLPNSQYDPNNLLPLPSELARYTAADPVEVVLDGGAARSAVIQAGGNVSIQASETLENSVIRQSYQAAGSVSRVGNTAAQGTGKATLVTLNSQLPPDLQQRQVNPLSLPGFILPQGENGLFRLSSQAATSTSTSATRGATADFSLAASGVNVNAAMEAQGPAATNGSAWSVQSGQNGVASTNAASLEVKRVQGLPSSTVPDVSHKYLIETNPALTDLKQFMSSDYLLGDLGYDTDATQKRLGDGLYEQRLIREAIVARTGQRYLAGLTNDEAMFRYLMDNAIASKNALGLSLGVSLTAEQVAALTHDIVWMEEHEVMGEMVLVPVLYLAQAEGRLAANGALIQGRDVTLISGGDLINQGTLRASNNLNAQAGDSISNSGLIEAGNRLELLASDSIRNAQGGIIAGRDVNLTALTGDVINERSVTRHEVNYGSRHSIQDYVDSAARIEAANSLSVVAGRDIANLGGVLESRGDLTLDARRDVTIASVEERTLQARGGSYLDEHVTQLGAQVSAGNDLDIKAGRDLTAIASQLDARRDASLVAGGDIVLASAANEDHFYSKGKKVTRSTDKIVQQSTTLQAGRDIAIVAGQDLTLVASEVKAGNNVALDAEQDINILSGKDESASFYFKKKKGSFGRSSSKQQENYDSTNVASVIEAGNDLTVNASKSADGGMSIDGGRDVTVIGSQLKAGGDLLVASAGDVAVLSGVEEHGSYSKKTKSGFLGLSKSGKSQLKTTASQVASELEAGNDVVIAAGNDVRLRASEAAAGNDVELRAGLVTETGDINLVSANDEAYSLTEQYKKKVGLSSSGGFVSVASAKEAGKQAQSSTSVGSQVAAERDATLQAERDINIVGSGISAGRNVSLGAGRDVNVVAAEDSNSQRSWEKSKQVGVGVSGDDNGVSFFAGAERTQVKDRLVQDTAAASQISAGQDLDITARRDVNQTGSDLLASNDMSLLAGRNINIDAARETQLLEQQRSEERQGLGVTVNHNYGNTKDAIANAGNGDNNVSKGSSTLKAIDAYSQFISGSTADVRLGNSQQSTSQQYIEQSNRSSTLSAGNDLNLLANNDVTVRGGQLEAGRDINVKGRDVTFDVAQGTSSQESQQSQSWGGIHGGTSGGIKVGIGGSRGVASEDWTQGTSTTAQLAAGRDINLHASNDLGLIGTQVRAGRDIDLKAGNDLTISAAQNASSSESDRHSAGGEVGLTFGSEGVGVYASVNLGKGHLEREGERQQEAYLYAGERLSFSSGKDTTIAGAELRGDEVIGRVGRDLRVSSLPDTGEVKGKEFDLSATVTIGPGAGFSGSVGYGETTGKTNWVEEQTRITARDRLDIRTENHTQLDGALLASDNGNLKVDTGTLGYSDIAGEDRERSYYLNVGGTYKAGNSSTQQDPSQEGKGEKGESGWSVEGYEYEKEREQIVRATVGAGEVIVRDDAETGSDSTAGLNRDVSKAYEVTKDEEERTDLYLSKSSVEAVSNPKKTLQKWNDALLNYGDSGDDLLVGVAKVIAAASSLADGHSIDDIQLQQQGIETLRQAQKALERALDQLSKGDAEQKAAAAEFLMRANSHGAVTTQSQAIAASIAQLAEHDPEGAVRALRLLGRLNSKGNDAQQNFGPLLLGVPIYEALGAALLAGTAATPAGQESLGNAANRLMEASGQVAANAQDQVRMSADLWTLVIGTAFPIHMLDPKYGTLVNPIVDLRGENPASGGYAEGGRIITVPHTGGNQLDGPQGGTSYTTPEHQLNPGNMYSEAGAKDKYTPNAGSVGNMGEFLRQPGLGEQVAASAQKTKQIYQGQSVYQAGSSIGDYLAKGDKFYLDGMHKNHLEAFDSKGRFKAVLNLDGTYNLAKTSKAISEGRKLPK